MIVPVRVKRRFSEDKENYFVLISRDHSKSDFLRAAQVAADSLASELIERVYDCLVAHSVDIQEEYQKYYSDEYDNLGSFLYWKYNIDVDTIEQVESNLRPGQFLGYGSVYWGGDYNLGQFVMSEPGLQMIDRIFDELREMRNED